MLCGADFGIASQSKLSRILRTTHRQFRRHRVHQLQDGKSMGGYSCSDVKEKMTEAYEQAKREGTLPSAD